MKSQLDEVAKYAQNIPIRSRMIDYYTPEDWPSPWEILSERLFCHSGTSLLICYTIKLINSDCNLTIELIDDGEDIYLVPVVDNKHVLNYQLGVVSNKDDLPEVKTIKVFSDKVLKDYR